MSFVAMSRIINTLILVQKKEVNYYKNLKWRTPIRKKTLFGFLAAYVIYRSLLINDNRVHWKEIVTEVVFMK